MMMEINANQPSTKKQRYLLSLSRRIIVIHVWLRVLVLVRSSLSLSPLSPHFLILSSSLFSSLSLPHRETP
jgi:hypothetical protein